MFKNILVAVDGSPASRRGLQTAIDLASDQHARLRILHVVEIFAGAPAIGDGFIAPDVVLQVTDALRSQGRQLLDRSRKTASDRGVDAATNMIESLSGNVAHAIVREAAKAGADLVVLGTHGRRGLRRVLMGSDAESVLRQVRTPILLVRGPAKDQPRKRSRPRLGSAKAEAKSTAVEMRR